MKEIPPRNKRNKSVKEDHPNQGKSRNASTIRRIKTSRVNMNTCGGGLAERLSAWMKGCSNKILDGNT